MAQDSQKGGSNNIDSQRPSAFKELMEHVNTPAGLAIVALLIVEFLIALVVIFSRMSPGYQFLCVIILASPILLLTSVGVRYLLLPRNHQQEHPVKKSVESVQASSVPYGARPMSRISASTPSGGSEDVHDLVQRLEEIADRTRSLPFSVSLGFDEEEFTYTTLKLKAALASVPSEIAQVPEVAIISLASKTATTAVQPTLLSTEIPPMPIPVVPSESVAIPSIISDDAQESLLETASIISDPMTTIVKRSRKSTPVVEPLSPVIEPIEVAEVPIINPQLVIISEPAPIREEIQVILSPVSLSRTERLSAARNCLRANNISGSIEVLVQMEEDPEVCELLGISLESVGNRQAAIESMLTSVRLDPNRASSHCNFGLLLARDQRPKEALEQVEIALRLRPNYPAAKELYSSLMLIKP